ncbi:E3 ubiquitin-protein ligase bre1 [Irineochytrium annulatum]|nr:E3 ubiquitin-protein ligase bre1 [Irineochytrium annulatum]
MQNASLQVSLSLSARKVEELQAELEEAKASVIVAERKLDRIRLSSGAGKDGPMSSTEGKNVGDETSAAFLAEGRLKEINDLNLEKIELLQKLDAVKLQVGIPDDKIKETAIYQNLEAEFFYHQNENMVLKIRLEKTTAELEDLTLERRKFMETLAAEEEARRKTVEQELRKLEADLTRVRGNRDNLQHNLELRSSKDDVDLKHSQEIRGLANSLKIIQSERRLHDEITKLRERVAVYDSNGHADMQNRIKDLEQKVEYYQKSEARLMAEVDAIGKAWGEAEDKSMRKVLNLTDKEEHIIRLLAEVHAYDVVAVYFTKKTKYDQKCAMMAKQLNVEKNHNIALKRQSEKQLEQLRKLEEREKALVQQLAEKLLREKSKTLVEEADTKRRIAEQYELLRRKAENPVKEKVVDPGLQKELDEYKLLLKCSSCTNNFKTHVLLKCMHTFW